MVETMESVSARYEFGSADAMLVYIVLVNTFLNADVLI